MRRRICALTLSLALASGAQAADKVKVGFISTLSGPSAALGVDIRDGFQLAVKMNGGKLGGLPAEVLVGDDQFKPDVGRQIAEKYVRLDKVDFLTGFVFSNIMLAAVPVAFEARIIDRKSTRLNSSHGYISYAVFCLKKKKKSNRISHHRLYRIAT